MTKVYIVATPYHLLISIIKTILAKRIGKDIIIIYRDHFSSQTVNKLKTLFKEVFPFNRIDNFINLLCLKIHQKQVPILSLLAKQKYGIDKAWFKDKEVFIFNDANYYGCLLNFYKQEYYLLEDGLNCYSWDAATFAGKEISKIYSLLGFSWNYFGHSKYTKSIEVNDISKAIIKHPRVIEANKEQMFLNLNEDEINTIAEAFGYQSENIFTKGESTLLLTQPLSEDGDVSHSKKIKIYRYLIAKYSVGTLYIKAHPRDKDDYSRIFPNAIILKNNKIPRNNINGCNFLRRRKNSNES